MLAHVHVHKNASTHTHARTHAHTRTHTHTQYYCVFNKIKFTHYICELPQEQYAFIHDALCDYLMCGDTSVAAHELRMEIQSLHQADAKTRKSGFQQQFEVQWNLYNPALPYPASFQSNHCMRYCQSMEVGLRFTP